MNPNKTYKMSSISPLQCICICCCCGDIELMYLANSSDDPYSCSQMWDSGIVSKIEGGYGSVAICDSCVKNKVEIASLIYVNNYMFPDEVNPKNINKTLERKIKLRKIINNDDGNKKISRNTFGPE